MLKRAALAVALLAACVSQASAQAGPIELVLVVDRSASMAQLEGAYPRMSWIKNGVLSAINELPPDARIGIVAYDATPEVVMPMQEYDRFEIQRALDALVPIEGADLAAALATGLELFAAEGPGPRIVIILTDGVAPAGDFAALGAAYAAAGAIVFPTVLGPTGDVTIQPLATATGGRFEAFVRFDRLDGLMRTEVLDWRDDRAARQPATPP
jgi:hypothetical protein